jgi:hypothetical protein
MNHAQEALPCRSRSPEGTPCTRPRGHRREVHVSKVTDEQWYYGINQPARSRHTDNRSFTEGEYDAFGRYGY